MKNVFFALAFMLVGTFSFANNAKEVTTINYDETVEITSNRINSEILQVDKCTVTVSGYDEWGCHYSHTYVFTGTISASDCDALGAMMNFAYLMY